MKRNLVVEDEQALQCTFVKGLQLLSFHEEAASDSKEALNLYYEYQYDLEKLNRELFYQEQPLSLIRMEFETMSLLLSNRRQCLESDKLMDHLWRDDSGTIDKLKVLIKKLRKKLLTNIVKNKWGVGYYVSKDEYH